MTAQEALHTYFGYDSFRPMQEEIIRSVLDGKDTLALLPTGGGKSLCFQVPTMVMAAESSQHASAHNEKERTLCLVVTPLVALMKDQVENLKKRNIHAAAVYTGMTYDQQQVALDNCQYGPYHFLYVSPERLENTNFRIRLERLPIGLIAVDEAHCISQWGYDFRPSYLKIAEIREKVHCPVLALTATATPEVVVDIQEKLGFKAPNVFRKSFVRSNLTYVVRHVRSEHATPKPQELLSGVVRTKDEELLHILQRVPGSAIVYVRNRKRTEELAGLIGLDNATFYHAGLLPSERVQRQEMWKQGQKRIIVCTNAFGMGIDKPDVRLVVHYDLPDSIEAYFQEAGRAGRDEQQAYAVLLFSQEDKQKARKRVGDNYPPKEFVENVYHKTADFLQVGAGSGLGHTFALHMDELCRVMHLPVLQTYSALHLLSLAGYVDFQEEQDTQARVKVNVPLAKWQEYALDGEQMAYLQMLLRHYPGVMTDLQYLREDITPDTHRLLAALAARHIVTYIPHTRANMLTFTRERQTDVVLPLRVYEERQTHYVERLKAMVEYAEQTQFCRSQLLVNYFGETDAPCCGTCDVCRHHHS